MKKNGIDFKDYPEEVKFQENIKEFKFREKAENVRHYKVIRKANVIMKNKRVQIKAEQSTKKRL